MVKLDALEPNNVFFTPPAKKRIFSKNHPIKMKKKNVPPANTDRLPYVGGQWRNTLLVVSGKRAPLPFSQ